MTIGFLYPGHSAEDDYPVLADLTGEPLRVAHTDIGEDAHRMDALLRMGALPRLTAALVELPEVDAVVWACTSASFVYGWDGALEQVRELSAAAGVPASSTSFAFAHAAHALGVTRLAVAATYPADVAGMFAEFLKAAGAQVLSTRARGIVTAAEVGTLGRAEVVELARAGDHPDAEAVLLPDTALHTAAHLTALEEALGKPVLTANQVTVWEGLRLVGRTVGERPELGALFAAGG
ncbi:Maleate isomerase [Streptomyces sp. RB5]|uniref:Maleate isomerase n=1 Tax=Streptomyces smaragdinus TaxID=2585196 RepID=A0A7K0CKI2_9ACTN|nr:decarboxylase [Streptomyces smaragdinus]MQY13921.1 Maleate isomerase [Streptomyces smaragdinus]